MNVGKKVGPALYVHNCAVCKLSEPYTNLLTRAEKLLGSDAGIDTNVVKLDLTSSKVSFLNYRDYFDDPFPALCSVISVDVSKGISQFRSYQSSENPPILHRKELLLPASAVGQERFQALTDALEAAGVYEQTHKIGHRRQWAARLAQANIGVRDHRVVKLSETPELSTEKPW